MLEEKIFKFDIFSKFLYVVWRQSGNRLLSFNKLVWCFKILHWRPSNKTAPEEETSRFESLCNKPNLKLRLFNHFGRKRNLNKLISPFVWRPTFYTIKVKFILDIIHLIHNLIYTCKGSIWKHFNRNGSKSLKIVFNIESRLNSNLGKCDTDDFDINKTSHFCGVKMAIFTEAKMKENKSWTPCCWCNCRCQLSSELWNLSEE